jgi:hypothetical protein
MALTSFADVQAFLTKLVPQVGPPHSAFWNTTYTNFVNGNVPNVTDPSGNGNPIPILVSGFSGQSNIIFALSGTPNTWWDPNAGIFNRMPYGGPYFSAAQIQELADWINAGCPQ